MKKSIIMLMAAALLTACSADLPEGAETIKVGDVEFNMIPVEAGEFTMGGTSEQTDCDFFRERPAHKVKLTKGYMIGETEVTQELWEAVMHNNPSLYQGQADEHNLPVTNISWEDCQKFIKELNKVTGRTFRLPTEAEWEYAARGGQKGIFNPTVYAGADKSDVCAYHVNNSNHRPHPVGLMMRNELGLCDMSGNVAEWCADQYAEYADSVYTDPCVVLGNDSTKTQLVRDANYNGTACYVVRGGHFMSRQSDCRTSSRESQVPSYKQTTTGLRLAMDM